MSRRTAIKWLHWISAFLILYLVILRVANNETNSEDALSTYAGVGMVLAAAVAIWFSMYLMKGMMGKSGPKLSPLTKRIYLLLNKGLYYIMPVMVLTGAFAAFMAPFTIKAFDSIPVNFGVGHRQTHLLAQDIHNIVFNAMLVLIVIHALFHIWRHFRVKDNALKIITPKILHKYL